MYILGFETTGPLGSAAIIEIETGEVKTLLINEPMSHLKNVASLGERLLQEEISTGKVRDNLAAVSASIGPGSFTGIRIGVTLARSIGQALELPLISAPTLELFRERCTSKDSSVAVILNARRGQVYGGVFAYSENQVKDLLTPGPYMLTDVLSITDEHPGTIFYGDGIDYYHEELKEREKNKTLVYAGEDIRYQSADMVVRLALEKYKRGEILNSPLELLPDYMRLSEAEQKLKDGTLQKLREEKMARFIKHNS